MAKMLFFCLMLLALPTASTASVRNLPYNKLGTADFHEFLQDALANDGIITVTAIDGFEEARANALTSLVSCIQSDGSADAVTSVQMEDGKTLRQTLATTTHMSEQAFAQLPSFACEQFRKESSKFRALVEAASERFVQAIDSACSSTTKLRGSSAKAWIDPPFHTQNSTQDMDTLQALVKLGDHLEHFHVYSRNMSITTDRNHHTLDMHTDAGMFIAMTPALLLSESTEAAADMDAETGLFVKLGNGEVVFPMQQSGLTFMLGDGASRWLENRAKNSKCSFRPTPHGLDMGKVKQDVKRSWYGRMFLLPNSVIVQDESDTGVSYGEFMQAQSEAIGAGKSEGDPIVSSAAHVGARTLFSAAGGTETCSATGAGGSTSPGILCWMKKQCYSTAELQCTGAQKPTCVDPSGNPQDSATMCPTCKPACYAPPPPPPPKPASAPVPAPVPFCDLQQMPTVMYMSGFVGVGKAMESQACTLYLFHGWELDDALKFGFACFGTFLAALLCEGLIKMRRKLQEGKLFKWQKTRSQNAATARDFIGLVLYGVQQVMGYFLMLVVMMYQTELFIMVILGLVVGHAIFNLNGLPPVGESADMCCQRGAPDNPDTQTTDPACCCPKNNEGVLNTKGLAEEFLPNTYTHTTHASRPESQRPAQYVLTVEGMMCQSNCGSTVHQALAQVVGVTEVKVNFATKTASVWGYPAAPNDLIDAVGNVGFDAKMIRSFAASP